MQSITLSILVVLALTCPAFESAPTDSVLLSGNFKELSLLMRQQQQQQQQQEGAQGQQRQVPIVKPGFSYGFAHTAPLHGGAIGVLPPEEAAAEAQRGKLSASLQGDDQDEPAGYLATQYHTQSHEGDAAFGYAHPGQAHTSIRDANGGVTGSYSYISPDGTPIHVKYIADSAGFRVVSNALPDSNGEIPLHNQAAVPAPVQDTPEVKAAKEEHSRLFAAIRANREQRRQQELQHSPLTQFLHQFQ